MTRFSLGYIGGGAVVPPKGMANGAILEEDTVGNINPALPAGFTPGQYALLFASASHTADAAVPAFTAPAGWTAILNGASSGGDGASTFPYWKERLAIYGKRLQAGDATPNVAVGWSGVTSGGFVFLRRGGFVRTYDNVSLTVPFESATLQQNIEADETVTGISIGGRAILDSGRLAIVALGWSGIATVGTAPEWDTVPGGPTSNLHVDERIFRVAGTTPTQSKPYTVPIGFTNAVVRAELSLVPA